MAAETFDAAIKKTTERLDEIGKEWDVEHFPRFFKSCQMHKSSWEKLKLRFMESVVKHHVVDGSPGPFVISFMGSSVAAGHDSNFAQSYPMVAWDLMKEPFAAAGVELLVRNPSLGNNPCMPYDVCVGTFAGVDADIVHWEQSYNCFDPPMYEQFARQASFLPKQPLVVYSGSETAHWKEEECIRPKPPKTGLTKEEAKLLGYVQAALKENTTVTKGVEMIVSEMNKDEFHKAWDAPLKKIAASYSGLGIQGFTHTSHDKYACMGPYISSWIKGAAAWHPSVIAHRLRAAHFSFFWLLAFREALIVLNTAIHAKKQSPATVLEEIHKKNAEWAKKHKIPKQRLNAKPPGIPDRAKCFTNVEPKAVKTFGLSSIVIGGSCNFTDVPDGQVASFVEKNRNVWGSVIMDLLIAPEWTLKGRQRGQVDYKYAVYGSTDSGPLSLRLDIADTTQKSDRIFICQVAGEFGQLPKGWIKLGEALPEFYVTRNEDTTEYSLDANPYKFDKDKAQKMAWKKTDDYCISFTGFVDKGSHVLTVVPTSASRFHFSYVLTA